MQKAGFLMTQLNYLPISDDLCGIFVKSITEGSAASMNGQIQVNDQIIEVIIDDIT